MLQGRQFRALENGHIDVFWSMTSQQRGNEALAIKIPTAMGLMGYRVLVIRNNEQQRFASLHSASELKQMLALQGHDWPDTDILLANGFDVHGVSWSDKMYRLLSNSHFDYFPRGLLEVAHELRDFDTEQALALEQRWLLYYPTAMYFFVAKSNAHLAARIEYGLERLAESGELKSLLLNHPHHKDALKIVRLKGRELIHLRNPLLPESVPLLTPLYWLTLEDLIENQTNE
ncbi:hypothetical protein AAEU32_09925 [Pseudoalteromonas sp. SSDWG2]|uniref:hypothetical protein n=1 Tax=Pseudoalteromonas sp. SSDWG2 TaxID=3139391 RepID=UPI003BAB0A9A